jgi:hypothetical protein
MAYLFGFLMFGLDGDKQKSKNISVIDDGRDSANAADNIK